MTSAGWPSQNLRNLERAGSLKPEPTSAGEIQRLLRLGTGNLAGARNISIALEARYQLAYGAAHYFALAALRANDFRTAGKEGHRMLVFQTLPHTAGVEPALSATLDRAHRKRNELEYSGAVDVTESETRDLIETIAVLERTVRAWIRQFRPELLESK